MMKKCDESVKINHNQNWIYLPSHPYRILISGSGSGSFPDFNNTSATKYLQNLFICQRSIRIKVSITSQRKRKRTKKLKNPKAFFELKTNLGDCNPTKKRKVLIVFDDNSNIFQTTRFSHTMIFFKLTD